MDLDFTSRNLISTTTPPIEPNFDGPEDDHSHYSMIVKWVVFLLAFFQTRFCLSDMALGWLLRFLSALLKALGKFSGKINDIAKMLPTSLFKHHQHTIDISHSSDSFEKRVVCKSCWSLYRYEECLSMTGSLTSAKSCSFKHFSSSRRCSALLLKEIVSSSGRKRYYPHLIFCFTSLVAGLQNLVLCSNFLEQCESTREMFSTIGYADVYDGQLWKEFQTVEGSPFLCAANCYGLLVNVDWFQPYKHIVYSVGVIYIAFLNLPRLIRFKRENIIIVGIIPGPSEPSLTLNTILAPLVSELLDLWKGVKLKLPNGNVETFKCALLGVSCDLPAGRKVTGFLSYNANYGCPRCYQSFASGLSHRNYSDFNRDSWKLRTNEQHRSDVKEILRCNTKTARAKKEAELGCRYSVLLDLPYFDPVRMLLLDPMHNLFLGTAKRMVRNVWAEKYLDKPSLLKIEHRLREVVVPSGLGRLPVSVAAGTFLTAEQWKNWTLYFSIYCLHDILPKSHLECWRHFVLACQKLSPHEITENDVTVADLLLLRFCKKVFELYGHEALTPNIHLHCHLASCIREFGPMHSYWLFPFERYNGILGNQPTNNRSIELQLIRRFQRDNIHLQLIDQAKQWPDADLFLGLIAENVNQCDTSDTSTIPCSRYTICCLAQEEISILKVLYSKLYPQYSQKFGNQIPISSIIKKFTYIVKNGKRIGSECNENAKNCFITASPMFAFTTSAPTEFDGTTRPAKVSFFLQHTITLPSSESKSHIFAYSSWPMVHPKRFEIGKPVEIWCHNLYEPSCHNCLLPVNCLRNRVIFIIDDFCGEKVLITIPVLH